MEDDAALVSSKYRKKCTFLVLIALSGNGNSVFAFRLQLLEIERYSRASSKNIPTIKERQIANFQLVEKISVEKRNQDETCHLETCYQHCEIVAIDVLPALGTSHSPAQEVHSETNVLFNGHVVVGFNDGLVAVTPNTTIEYKAQKVKHGKIHASNRKDGMFSDVKGPQAH
eukprot:8386449-Ditylum_brightwellii.AAC.1